MGSPQNDINHGLRSVSNASDERSNHTKENDTLDIGSQGEWSVSLKNSTAILQGSTAGTTAYILGVSHVSKESCGLIEELIEKVKPDAVMLELCHERTGLLIDEKAASTGRNAWFSDNVDIAGLDKNFEFKEQLMKRLKTYHGCPVSTQGIQSDADILLATGLFESVTPVTAPPAESGWDPMFVYVENMKKIIPGVQLGAIQFKVVPRMLPHVDRIAHMTFEDAPPDVDTDALCEIINQTYMNTSNDTRTKTLDALIEVKKQVYRHTDARCDIMYQFDDVSDGSMRVTARIVASKGLLFEHTTSFEETVRKDGTGVGIKRRPNAPQFMGFQTATTSSVLTTITPWDGTHIDVDTKSGEANSGILESLATMLTMTYGKYQADAGQQVGILPGEAWRVAFEAAAKAKTPYIFLGDRRASITGERLLKAIIASSLPLYLAGAAFSMASWLTPTLLLNVPSSMPITLATFFVSIAAASWPLISPILEIKAFSEMSAKEIENAVRVNEPLQSNTTSTFYLWGEDALIRWPGAEEPVIGERDEYMARSILGFLNNVPSDLTPTYVATSKESYGATIYSYAMPKDASNVVCPTGKGQGQFELGTKSPRTVVAIVGTAHVRGMINHFESGCTTTTTTTTDTRRLEELSM